MKFKDNFFNLSTIRGRALVIIAGFLLVLALISGLLVAQNHRTKQLLSDISTLRIPVPLTTSDILIGINQSGALQRAYLLTGNDQFKTDRNRVWENTVKPAKTALNKIKNDLHDEEQRLKIDKAIEQLNNYHEVQREIDIFFEENLKDQVVSAQTIDSAAFIALYNNLQERTAQKEVLESLISGKAEVLRRGIQEILEPMSNEQEVQLQKDYSRAEEFISQANMGLLISFIFVGSIIILVAFRLIKDIKKSVDTPSILLKNMAEGKLMDRKINSKDELNGILENSFELSENIRKASKFALEIGEGVFNSDYKPSGKNDELGNALLQMSGRLQHVAEEDRKMNWSNTGFTQLGDILRKEGLDEEELYNNVISFMVKYLNANQGALYLTNDDKDNIQLEMVSCYAYGRKKYISSSFAPGEGLIGQVYLEQDATLLKEVPQSYVKITSGLGEATPACLFASPLMANEECYGVIEIASFSVLEDYQIKFVKRAGEQIATSLSKIRINAKTTYLLRESQQQAEELRAQEEEVRQNMEELQATQEEMARKDIEMSGQLNAIDNTMATIEFSVDGIILNANEKFLRTVNYSLDEVQNKHHRLFVDPVEAVSEEYKEFWNKLKAGASQIGEFKRFAKNGHIIWLSATYTPVMNNNGEPVKVIKFAQNITEQKLQSLNFEGQMNALNNNMAIIEFDLKGNIRDANANFLNAMGYNLAEVKGAHHRIFVDFEDTPEEKYERFWDDLRAGLPKSGEFRRLGKGGKEVWISASYSPIKDLSGKVIKIVKFAQDVTEQKLKSVDIKGQLEAINRSTAVVEFDLKGHILNANDIFINAMGYSRLEDVKGKHHSIFVSREDLKSQQYKELWETLNKGKYHKGQFKRIKATGEEIWINGSYNPILDAKGKPYKVVKFVQVVEKEIKLQKELA
ncbi:MAG: PAS domain S-box protein [Candidatus Cyclobacteriaceae bacterium M2_1C_046]